MPETVSRGFPRRIQMLYWTRAEHAIANAVRVVEEMGADLALTDAVILLGQARDRVADYVDAHPTPAGPMELGIDGVQQINVARANRWHGGNFHQWSGLEWAGAMCGEAGEAANVAKKLRRYELELEGNQFSDNRPMGGTEGLRAQLAHECADTFLYLTLLTARYDIDLATAVRDRFNAKSEEMGFPERV